MSPHLSRSPAWLCFAAIALCSGSTVAAELASGLRLMRAPAQLQVRKDSIVRPASKRAEFEKSYDLFIRYTEGSIYNPDTATYDKVKLRAYQQKTDTGWNGEDGNSARFQAPTVVMAPGQTVRFKLHNQLPEQTQEACAIEGDLNTAGRPGCFNITNLHAHGLWVSPSGNSDNVMISINPNVNFEYEYNIPIDHPAGTFWYHPHQHGATAMQVASGMAGTLIVEGDRYPTSDVNGDVDVLLKKFRPAAGSSAEVMMLQQIPYGCANAGQPDNWHCPGSTSSVGTVEDFQQVNSSTAWKNSGRYTAINGQVQPVLSLFERQVYRWRLVDTGFQSSVVLRIKRATDAAKLESYIKRPNGGEDVAAICDGEDVTQFEVASDGLTHGKIISKTASYLQPGYRSDIVFALPKAGAYCIYDEKGSNDLNPEAKNTRLMGIIRAGANPRPSPRAKANQTQAEFMQAELIAAANQLPPSSASPALRKQIADDLKDGLRLSLFVPHKNFTPAEEADLRAGKKEYVTFNMAKVKDRFRFMVQGDPALDQPPAVEFAYVAGRIDHTLVLGEEQMWELNSRNGNHPFHIHVNPFQVVSIVNTNPGKRADDLDPQYKDLVGTWKDTLLVMQGYKIEIATRYQRYIGEYVLHCHILEHEDQGMMQNVKVVLPDGKGGAAEEGHAHH